MDALAYGIAGCWILFATVWVLSAPFRKATRRRMVNTKETMLRVGILLVTFLFLTHRIPSATLRMVVFPPDLVNWSLALILTALGIGFAIYARFTLGRNWSGIPKLLQNHELITKFFYEISSNEIYTGVLLALAGTAVFIGKLFGLLLLAMMLGLFLIKMQTEEKIMEENFPEEYPAYRKRVKRLIPWLW